MVKVKTFRKKPLEIQAFQVNSLDQETVEQIEEWVDNGDDDVGVMVCNTYGDSLEYDDDDFDEFADHIEIVSEDGDVILKFFVGDYVVKGIDGSVYPVKESTFKKTYEDVSECNSDILSKAITW